MVVMTEVGRRLAPEPVAQAALIPGGLVAEVGTDEQKKILDDVSAGTALLAFAHDEPGAHVTTGELETRAERSGDTWTVSGRKNPVLAGDSADKIIVTAALPDGGVGLYLVDGASTTRHPYRTFDGRRGAQVDLDSVPAEPLGSGRDAREHIARTVIRYQAVLCAEAVGAMDEALRLTTAYLDERKQFGVPLKQLPDADAARSGHVRVAGARPQHELLCRNVDRRRQRSTRWLPRGPNCRSRDPARISLRKPSSCTAASA